MVRIYSLGCNHVHVTLHDYRLAVLIACCARFLDDYVSGLIPMVPEIVLLCELHTEIADFLVSEGSSGNHRESLKMLK